METLLKKLEEILKEADTTDIIEWIRSDDQLEKILKSGRESFGTEVYYKCGRYYERLIPELKQPRSYISFLFQTEKWIQVNGERYSVDQCLNNKDLSVEPYIVSPDIDSYIKNLEGKRGKLKNEYSSILKAVGVEESFSELPINMIYSVLSKLHLVDKNGDKAKAIYDDLIEAQFDEKELSKSSEYKDFLKNGLVYTSHGFKKTSEAFYLHNRNICSKIAEKYNLIGIPVRKNSKKIEQIFGVKKLEINGELYGTPIEHSYNKDFNRDFKNFLPLAFCYRINSKQNSKAEAKKFSRIHIDLCSSVKAKFEDDVVELDNWEFIKNNKGVYCLKAPEQPGKTLKNNYGLANAVCNIICSHLDLEEIDAIRELYHYSPSERKELIADTFSDPTIVDRAKNMLNFNEDFREEFISIFSSLVEKKDSELKNEISKIDFDDFSIISNAPIIIELFKKYGIDIDDYNAANPLIELDLREYYSTEIQRVFSMYEKPYKVSCYNRLKNATLEKKIKLVDCFFEFNKYEVVPENSVNFNVDDCIIRTLQIDNNSKDINLNSIYNKNLKSWKKGKEEIICEKLLENDNENTSLIYFGEYKELNKRYNRLASEIKTENDLANGESITKYTKQPRMIKSFTIIPEELHVSGSSDVKTVGYKQPSRQRSERIGLKGEQIVYNELQKSEKYKLVNWKSENAKKAGVNPEGAAGYGYDIEVIDNNDNHKYIEVKSTSGADGTSIKFQMSDNEYEFAKEHHENFEIWFVNNVDSQHPAIIPIERPFNEDGPDESSFSYSSKSEYFFLARIST